MPEIVLTAQLQYNLSSQYEKINIKLKLTCFLEKLNVVENVVLFVDLGK